MFQLQKLIPNHENVTSIPYSPEICLGIWWIDGFFSAQCPALPASRQGTPSSASTFANPESSNHNSLGTF